MNNDAKHRILRAIAHQPRALTGFTDGSMGIAAHHITRYADEMKADGLMVESDGLLHATAAGIAEIAPKPIQTVESRTWCAASTKGTYVPAVWNVRAGAEKHLAIPSLGMGA